MRTPHVGHLPTPRGHTRELQLLALGLIALLLVAGALALSQLLAPAPAETAVALPSVRHGVVTVSALVEGPNGLHTAAVWTGAPPAMLPLDAQATGWVRDAAGYRAAPVQGIGPAKALSAESRVTALYYDGETYRTIAVP
jgi:hypothetical protein